MKYIKARDIKPGNKVLLGGQFSEIVEVATKTPRSDGHFEVALLTKGGQVFTRQDEYEDLVEEPVPVYPKFKIVYTKFSKMVSAVLKRDGESIAYGPWRSTEEEALSVLLEAIAPKVP